MSTATLMEPSPIATTKLMTGEELYALNTPGMELIQGRLQAMAPTGFEHGIQEADIAFHLKQFVRQQQLGKVMVGEVGIYTSRNPDTVRAADVLFISHERLSQVRSSSYLDVAPELVVEILSPHDSWGAMLEKLEDYFGIGVVQVWLVDPRRQTVQICTTPTHSTLLRVGDGIQDIPFLPGFALPVAELFSGAT